MDAPVTADLRAGVELAARLGLCPPSLAAGEADRLRRQLAVTFDPAGVAERLHVSPALLSALSRIAARLPADTPLDQAREALLAEGFGVPGGTPTVSSGPTIPPESMLPATRRQHRLPSRLGPYELGQEIGHGGMGIVFRARHQSLGAPCAIKVMIAGEHASPESIARFQREAAAVAKMGKHPNIVTVFDLGESEGLAYYAMELVDGVPLGDWRRERSPGYHEIAQLVEKVARALHFAHEHAVVHRDVKPENVIVRADGEPQVMDFGLAREMGTSVRLSTPGQVMGTPSYMAPEQARGDLDHVDRRSDVYSLGGVLYELLVGVPPHAGKTIEAVLDSVLRGEVVPPRRIARDVPTDLETICMKCLSPEPSRRYATAQELAEDLARYSRRETIVARRAGTVERLARKAVKHRAVVVPIAIVVLAASSLSAWLLDRKQRADEQLALQEGRERTRREAKEHLDLGRTKPPATAVEEFTRATAIDPAWSEPWLELGRAHIVLEDDAAALSALNIAIETAIRAGEKPLQARYLRGWLYDTRLFDPGRARADYLATVELDPDSDLALLSLGAIHLRALESTRAVECFRRAARANPQNPEPLVHLARVAWKGGRFDVSVEMAEKATLIDPGHRAAEAIALAAEAAESGHAGSDFVDRIVRLCARDPELIVVLAQGLARLDGGKVSRSLLDRALEIAPRNPRCQVEIALWAQTNGLSPEQIIGYYDRAVEFAPRDWTAPLYRGSGYVSRGKAEDLMRAKADFARVIALDPAIPNVWILRALVSDQEGRHLQALDEAARGLALNPDPAWAASAEFTRMVVHHDLAEPEAALDCIRRARADEQARDELVRGSTWGAITAPQGEFLAMWEAILLEQVGRYEEALAALDAGADAEEWEFETLWERGQLLLLLERYPEGAEALLEAAEMTPLDEETRAQLDPMVRRIHAAIRAADDPGDPPRILDPMVNMLWMLARAQGEKSGYVGTGLADMSRSQWTLWRKAGDKDGLLAAAKRWAKVAPKSPSALYHLAAAYAFAGQAAEASKALDDAEKAGFRDWARVRTASEFDPVRGDPSFRPR